MITLKYRKINLKGEIDPFYLLYDTVTGDADKIKIELPAKIGKIRIGEKIFTLKDGVCDIRFDEISFGEHSVFFAKKDKEYRASPIYKGDNFAVKLPVDEIQFENMRIKCDELSDKLAECVTRISEIEKTITPKPLFKF